MPASLEVVLPVRVRRIEKLTAPETRPGAPADGHAGGYAAGYEAGRLRAEWEGGRQRDTDRARIQALAAKIETIHQGFEKLLEEHLPELIQGALARVFRKHPFTAAEIATEVALLLREMEHAAKITLECAPAEAGELQRRLEDCEAVPNGVRWSLQPNATLASGEFLLKSDLGDVDGRHAMRTRQIHLALEGRA